MRIFNCFRAAVADDDSLQAKGVAAPAKREQPSLATQRSADAQDGYAAGRMQPYDSARSCDGLAKLSQGCGQEMRNADLGGSPDSGAAAAAAEARARRPASLDSRGAPPGLAGLASRQQRSFGVLPPLHSQRCSSLTLLEPLEERLARDFAQQVIQSTSGLGNWAAQGIDPMALEPLYNHQRYRKLKTLHRGSRTFVQLALNLDTGQKVAIKFLELDADVDGEVVMAELQSQRRCRMHPAVLQIQEVFAANSHLGIVTDFADSGNMAHFMASRKGMPLPEEEARRLFQHMATALAYCEALGLQHRDVTLDNFLLHQGLSTAPVPLLADFGFAQAGHTPQSKAAGCGTPEYVAPEVLSSSRYDGAAADVWSLGVCLYVLLCGAFPFLRQSEENKTDVRRMQAMFPRIVTGNFEPLPSDLSPHCRSLVHKMLTVDTGRRITAENVLAHPWVAYEMPLSLQGANARLLDSGASHAPWPPLAAAAQALQGKKDNSEAAPAEPRRSSENSRVCALPLRTSLDRRSEVEEADDPDAARPEAVLLPRNMKQDLGQHEKRHNANGGG